MKRTMLFTLAFLAVGCAPRLPLDIDTGVVDEVASDGGNVDDTAGDTGVTNDTGDTGPVDADGDGYTVDNGDCDDADPEVNPGAVETCNGVDDDCDGDVDEGVLVAWFYDDDLDGYGDPNRSTLSCSAPDPFSYVTDNTDCDDTDAALNQDDADEDGYSTCDGDCDDEDASVNPGAREVWYDGIDQNCDGADDYDADGDGYEADVWGGTDCDDHDASVYPGAFETWYDGTDQDCAGDSDYDADGDGYDSADYGGDDCDDSDASASPEAPETNGDGVDNNCNGDTDQFDFDLEWPDGGRTMVLTMDDQPEDDPFVEIGKIYVWTQSSAGVFETSFSLAASDVSTTTIDPTLSWSVSRDGNTTVTTAENNIGLGSGVNPRDPDAFYLVVLYDAPDFDKSLASGYVCYTKSAGDGVDASAISAPTGVTLSSCISL